MRWRTSPFQSAPPAREATPGLEPDARWAEFQSAPPAREATGRLSRQPFPALLFQSAPPAREATRPGKRPLCRGRPCFNPRLPRGRRHPCDRRTRAQSQVSIRASRAGGDPPRRTNREKSLLFQSAPPAREATTAGRRGSGRPPVSIRASRAGGDLPGGEQLPDDRGFNPRLPRGRRQHVSDWQSLTIDVSIRASRAGGDGTGGGATA